MPVTWSYTPKSGPSGVVPAGGFVEGAVDLDGLYGDTDQPCFSSFLAETRSSQELSATLKDLAFGKVDSCGSITIKKDATPDSSQSFGFTASGPDAKVGDFSLVDNGDAAASTNLFESIKRGTYSISENTVDPMWDFVDVSCTNSGPGTTWSKNGPALTVTLGPGGTVDCTYSNKRKPTLTVTKTVVPADDQGLSVEEYTNIIEVAQNDPVVRNKLLQRLK